MLMRLDFLLALQEARRDGNQLLAVTTIAEVQTGEGLPEARWPEDGVHTFRRTSLLLAGSLAV